MRDLAAQGVPLTDEQWKTRVEKIKSMADDLQMVMREDLQRR